MMEEGEGDDDRIGMMMEGEGDDGGGEGMGEKGQQLIEGEDETNQMEKISGTDIGGEKKGRRWREGKHKSERRVRGKCVKGGETEQRRGTKERKRRTKREEDREKKRESSREEKLCGFISLRRPGSHHWFVLRMSNRDVACGLFEFAHSLEFGLFKEFQLIKIVVVEEDQNFAAKPCLGLQLLRKNNPSEWNDECQNAFERIKQYLQNPPVLRPPVAGKPLILYLTVSYNSMGCMLGQHDSSGRIEHAIYYLSKKFTSCETNYSMLEKTCCSLAWVAHRLRQYMLYHTTWLISRMDPIKYIFEKPSLSGRIAKWQILLSEYDIFYVTQKAVKGSAIADYFAEQAIDDSQPMNPGFPDGEILSLEMESRKDMDRWVMLFDGASNIVGNGIGAVLISPEGKVTPFTAKLYFDCTNNVSEYEACAMGIQAAIDVGIKKLQVYGDSQLVIRQMCDEWETGDAKLVPYYQHIKELIKFFDCVEFDHIPREENQMADALATLAAMFDLDPRGEVEVIKIEKREIQAHCLNVVAEPDGKPWYYDVKQYLEKGEYPLEASDNDKRTIRRLSSSFFLDKNVLCKRSSGFVLLRCVDTDGIYADKTHVPVNPLRVLAAPWPFSMWGIDVIGPIEPKASNGHRFILVYAEDTAGT
ncbi:uncharacterized protein LOC119980725 [Tripterygium wilfordii]|uniref:uncharacterized protein LOC119980725 n=1 Tax=Tripterygium wilfordii TaxID=458696 RepID=UPI0018F8546C|nr:uncharacterized protein LOC119980725 [Tripterygium wilfordii]